MEGVICHQVHAEASARVGRDPWIHGHFEQDLSFYIFLTGSRRCYFTVLSGEAAKLADPNMSS